MAMPLKARSNGVPMYDRDDLYDPARVATSRAVNEILARRRDLSMLSSGKASLSEDGSKIIRYADSVVAEIDEEAANEDTLYAMNPALREFWETKARYKTLYGGRGSSKSHDAAGHAIFLAANFTLKILCARQFQNRISESVYTLLKDKIEASTKYKSEFEILKTSIRHKRTGSEFLFYGIARNLEEIKSTEGVDILWLEEAHYLNKDQWEVIEPTIRKLNSQVWVIFNPDEYTDFVYQNFVLYPPVDAVSKEINWPDNPFLSVTMLRVIYDAYRRDPEGSQHVYGGMPKMGADKSVIPLKYILAAEDAHKKLGFIASGRRRIGYDVADDGRDLNAMVLAHGNVIYAVEEWKGLEDQILASATKVFNKAKITGSEVVWDSIGVGAFVGSKFGELVKETKYKLTYEAFNAGGGVENPDGVFMKLPHVNILNRDHFSNIKAQKWSEVAERFRKTYEAVELGVKHPQDELISLDSKSLGRENLKKIQMELSAPRKDVDKSGKFKVESKDDLMDRGIKSPNIADALIMSMINPKRAAATFF